MPWDDKIDNWKASGFNKFLARDAPPTPSTGEFIGGAKFDSTLDEMLFNRMIKLKNLTVKPQGYDPGKIYWDPVNKKYKLWVDSIGGWANVIYTTTSTSSTSSSTSSTSISTSSTSTSTT